MTLTTASNGQYTFQASHQRNYICLTFSENNVGVQIDEHALNVDKNTLRSMDFYLVNEMTVQRTPEAGE